MAGGWLLAAGLNWGAVYGIYDFFTGKKDWRTHEADSVAYGGLHSISWAIGVGWVIVACQNHYAGDEN